MTSIPWTRAIPLLAAGGMVALAYGCGGTSSAPSAAVQPASAQPQSPAAKPPTPAVLPKLPEPGPALPPLTYDAKGRRDPFAPVRVATEKPGLDVATTKLVGVIQGRQLLALIEVPDGVGYILKPGDVLGNGRLTDITPHSATFAVAGKSGQRDTSVTLKLTSGE